MVALTTSPTLYKDTYLTEVTSTESSLQELVSHPLRLLLQGPTYRQDNHWAKTMESHIAQAVNLLEKQHFISAKHLFFYLAQAYRRYFNEYGQTKENCSYYGDFSEFGKKRIQPQHLNLMDKRFYSYIQRFEQLIMQPKYLDVAGQQVNIGQVCQQPDDDKKMVFIYCEPQWVYPLLEERVEPIFETLTQQRDRLPMYEVKHSIAQLHYELVHILPCERGTAGLTDMVSKVFCDLYRISTSRWQWGVAPDLHALSSTSIHEFIEDYWQLMEPPQEKTSC